MWSCVCVVDNLFPRGCVSDGAFGEAIRNIARFWARKYFNDKRDEFPQGVSEALKCEAYHRFERRRDERLAKEDKDFSMDERGDWSYARKLLAGWIIESNRK